VLQDFNELARETASYVAGAIFHKDASFLHDIAELAGNAEAQSDRLRVWLWHIHFGWQRGKLTQESIYTISELVNMATERRIWATPGNAPPSNGHRYMGQLRTEMGIKTKDDKRGRHKLPRPS
jgi:hypothetical protein